MDFLLPQNIIVFVWQEITVFRITTAYSTCLSCPGDCCNVPVIPYLDLFIRKTTIKRSRNVYKTYIERYLKGTFYICIANVPPSFYGKRGLKQLKNKPERCTMYSVTIYGKMAFRGKRYQKQYIYYSITCLTLYL